MAVTTQQLVAGAYSAVYDRAPDYVGFNFWTQGLDVNDPASVARFGQNFTNTQVFLDTYDGLLDAGQEEAFVLALYQEIQNRPEALVDEAGLSFWADALRDGKSHGEVFVEFIQAALGTEQQALIDALTAEGDLTPAQIAQVWQSVSLVQDKAEIGVNFVETLGVKASLGALPPNPTAAQLAADPIYALSQQVNQLVDGTAEGNANALQLIQNSALDGKDGVPVQNEFNGTYGNDVVSLTSADLNGQLKLIDPNVNDRDIVKLAANKAVNLATGLNEVQNFEAIEIDWQSQGQATVDLAVPGGSTAFKEALLTKSTAGGLGNLTVNGAGETNVNVADGFSGAVKVAGVGGANDASISVQASEAKTLEVTAAAAAKKLTVQADQAETITVNGAGVLGSAVVTAGSATTKIVAGVTATNSLTLNLNNASNVKVDAGAATTAELRLNVATGDAVTLDALGNGVAKTVVTAAGAVELKGAAAIFDGAEVTGSRYADLTVSLTGTTATVDLAKVDAEQIKLTAGAAAVLDVANQQALEVAAATKAATVAITAGNDVNLTLTSAEYTSVGTAGNALTINAASALTLGTLGANGGTASYTLEGAADSVTIKALQGATLLDASALTGTLTLGAKAAAVAVAAPIEIFGAQGGTTAFFGAVAGLEFLGNDGADAITLNGAATGANVLTLGGGNDTLTLATGFTAANGALVVDFGTGSNTLVLGVDLAADTVVIQGGLSTLSIDGAVTVEYGFLADKAYAVNAKSDAATLTIDAANEETVDLSTLDVAVKPVVGGLTVEVTGLDANSTVTASTGADRFDVAGVGGTAGNAAEASYLKIESFSQQNDKLVVANAAVASDIEATTLDAAILEAATEATGAGTVWFVLGEDTYVVAIDGANTATDLVQLVGVTGLTTENFVV